MNTIELNNRTGAVSWCKINHYAVNSFHFDKNTFLSLIHELFVEMANPSTLNYIQ